MTENFLHKDMNLLLDSKKENINLANNLNKLIGGGIGLVTLVTIADVFIMPQGVIRWISIWLLYTCVAFGFLFLNRKGYPRLTAQLFTAFIVVLVLGFAITAGGIKAPIIQILPLIVLVAGFLLGWKEGVVYGLLVVFSSFILIIIELYGLLPENNVNHNLFSIWVTYSFVIGFLLLVQNLFFGNLRFAFFEARNELQLRRNVEDELRKSEAFRHRVFDSSLIPIVVMDADTFQFIDCNQAAIAIYQFQSKEEVLGKTPIDVSARFQYDGTPSEIKSQYFITEALKSNSVVFEWRHQHPNGEFWDANVHLISFMVDDKKLLQFTLFDITESKRIDHALNSLATSYAGLSGRQFFEATSKHMAIELGLDFVYVGEFDSSKNEVTVLGGCACGNPMPDLTYNIKETPCADVLHLHACSYPVGVQQLFPEDTLLKKMGIESYFGAPIYDKNREPIGIMVALHSTPISNEAMVNSFFNIFLDRVTAEILRQKAHDALVNEIKERKVIEQSLIEKESRIHTISNNFNAGMIYQVIIDKKGSRTFTFLSNSVKQLYGVTSEEGMADSSIIYGRIHPDDLPDLIKSEEQAIQSLTTFKAEARVINPDGGIRWSLFTSTPKPMEDGSICWDGIEFVITDRKQAEESYRISAAQLKANLDCTPDVAVQWYDAQGRILYWNRASENIFGYSETEALGKFVGDLILSDDEAAELVAILSEIELTKQSHGPYETKIQRKDGSTGWVQSTVFSFPLDDSQTGFACMDVDISKRKMIENDLKESEELFKSLIQLAPISIGLTDFNYRFLLVNKAFVESNRIAEDEIIGKTALELGIRLEESTDKIVQSLIEKGQQIDNYEMLVHLPDGEKMELLFSSRVIQWKNSPALLTTSVNITEIKRIKQELESHKSNLELLVNERTHELDKSVKELNIQKNELLSTINQLHNTQEQLIHSEKMASIGVLSAGIAHEINNPLNFINGGLLGIKLYLKDHPVNHPEEINPLLEAIEVGLRRADEIVSSLNHYSRQDEIITSKCNVSQIIDNCLTILQSKLKNKVVVEKHFESDDAMVLGNEGKLYQVFMNIITNAEQAIPDKGVINIFTESKDDFLYIAISDNGCGIEADNIQKIFDPFFTTKAPGQGTGLGLSITYNIVKEHNGTLEFDSEPGVGTTAIIKMPMYKQN